MIKILGEIKTNYCSSSKDEDELNNDNNGFENACGALPKIGTNCTKNKINNLIVLLYYAKQFGLNS